MIGLSLCNLLSQDNRVSIMLQSLSNAARDILIDQKMHDVPYAPMASAA